MAESKSPAKRDERNSFDTEMSKLALEADVTTTDDSSLKQWIEEKLVAMLNADDFEAINAIATESATTASKTLVGRTFEVRDFALRESFDAFRENSALKKYVLIQAVDASTGEEFIIDGGGDTFVAGLKRMRDLYGFPFVGTILGLKTGSNQELLYWRFMDPKRPKLA